MRISLSPLITITCVVRSFQWADASSSAAPLSSSIKVVDSDIDGRSSDKPRQYKKKRRRRRQDGHAVEPSYSPLSNTLTQHETAEKRTKRRRRKKSTKLSDATDADDVSARADEILLPIPNDDEMPSNEHNIAIDAQPDTADDSLECDRGQSPILTETSDFFPSQPLEFIDLEGQEIINTTIQSEDSSETIQVSEGPIPTITTTHQRKFEKTELAESNDGQRITFTHQKRNQSVQITTKSHSGKSKSDDQLAKRVNTGKGGECLRRIKREWKDAVLMGIAYDWTRMKTIKRKETNSQNNYVRLGPFGKNLLRWHFSVMGPANSVYQDGIYHGRVLLPKDYPGSPPRVQVSVYNFSYLTN